MKKLLIVMTTLYNGGAEKSLVNMLNELPKGKYEIDVLLFKRRGLFLAQVPSEFTVLETPSDVKRLYGSLSDAGLLLPYKLIANGISSIFSNNVEEMRAFRWKHFYGKKIKKLEKKYDVALAYISGEVLYFIDEKVDADKKLVWIHTDYRSAGNPREYDHSYFERVNGIVTISDTCANILNEEFPEFKDKIYMIENITSSVVVKKRASEFVPEEYDLNTNCIVSVGRMNEEKGFDMAIEAASLLKKRGVPFKWYLVGSGDLEEQLKQQTEKCDVQDSFIMVGAKENPYPYIKNATVFIQPSRYEGKSVVIDEAKILGIPIIATNYPTVADQIKDGDEGIVVSMNPEGIADGVEKLLNSEELRTHLHQYLSEREYGNQDVIAKYMDLID
ncbi:glycosyltransferase [Butyrivibrio sp. AE3006]|uniref:glycosyltransferase n=1 Tax=Butyrivibrio sp. AE3006 TaxID=1280673 RepID=UPI0003FA0AC7|nr:glycosyltransferase [Butyrivibrio sp. AE3006]